MGRRRDLRPDELALWKKVTDRTAPLHPAQKSPPPAPPATRASPPASMAPEPPPVRPDLTDFAIGAKAAPGAAQTRAAPGAGPQASRMDARVLARMKRGKLPVEGRIDLHGLSVAEAHPRLTSFILGAHAQGRRLVLVITGKGRERDDDTAMPPRSGILRRQVPYWLTSAPLRPLVLEVSEAHRRHGGSGAFYVYLRRN